jgi:hypothetical protein
VSAPIVAFEEHGDVLAFWRTEGVRDATALVLDRHLDLKRIADRRLAMLDAAGDDPAALAVLRRQPPLRDDDDVAYGSDDFLYGAMHLGVLRRLVWVAPLGEEASARDLARTLWGALTPVVGHGHEVLETFAAGPASAHARVAGFDVELTTLSRVALLDLPDGVRVDVDLDFFYDPEDGSCRPPTAVALAGLHAHAQPETPVTAAYSIAAGHLPKGMRWLGGALAEALGRRLVHADVRAAGAICETPGATLAAASLAAVERGQLALAEHLCVQAMEAGDRATCAAYRLALHHVDARDYAHAARWLERVLWDLVDSVQARALVLSAACALRLGDVERGLRIAGRCVEALPLLEDGYVLAALSARALGDDAAGARYEARRSAAMGVLERAG